MQDISTTLKGRIGSEPIMKHVKGDVCVTTFRLAITRWRFTTDVRRATPPTWRTAPTGTRSKHGTLWPPTCSAAAARAIPLSWLLDPSQTVGSTAMDRSDRQSSTAPPRSATTWPVEPPSSRRMARTRPMSRQVGRRGIPIRRGRGRDRRSWLRAANTRGTRAPMCTLMRSCRMMERTSCRMMRPPPRVSRRPTLRLAQWAENSPRSPRSTNMKGPRKIPRTRVGTRRHASTIQRWNADTLMPRKTMRSSLLMATRTSRPMPPRRMRPRSRPARWRTPRRG